MTAAQRAREASVIVLKYAALAGMSLIDCQVRARERERERERESTHIDVVNLICDFTFIRSNAIFACCIKSQPISPVQRSLLPSRFSNVYIFI